MSASVVIHWFRRDLRLSDNTALHAAARSGAKIVPLFILDPALLRGERFGLPRLAFLLKGLAALDADLRRLGTILWIRYGYPAEVLSALAEMLGAAGVYANRDDTPYARKRDRAAAQALRVPLHLYDDALMHAAGEVVKENGEPFVVFTPFKRRWLALPKAMPSALRLTPDHFWMRADDSAVPIPSLGDLGYPSTTPVPDAGENTALQRLERFIQDAIYRYRQQRDVLSSPEMSQPPLGTSFLSPYFRFGMISPRQAFAAAARAEQAAESDEMRKSVGAWVNELAWREFYAHILAHYPHVLQRSFRSEYDRIDYRHAPGEFAAWQVGMTGYPVVDAAMRQLHAAGWMHNRARMIVASFLTKDLLIYWRAGEAHFMNWLIDGDLAANNGGWQWSAGTGTDAQPYFRVFNPVMQGRKFDPEGHFVRFWVPELRDVPQRYIHTPWEMPIPPKRYPAPIVDHHFARERALDAFKSVRQDIS